MLIAVPLGVGLAIGLTRWRGFGARPVNFLMLFPLVTPEIVMAVSLLLVFVSLYKIQLGTTAQALGQVTFSISYVVLVVRGRLLSVGRQYEEAARDLGASTFGALRLVLLPLLAPAIFASLMVVFALSIDDFVVTDYLSSNSSTQTVPIKIYSSVRGTTTPALNALATVMVLATLVAVVLAAARLPVVHEDLRDREGWRGGRARSARSMSDGVIDLVTLRKTFSDVVAVDGIDLHVDGGEFFSLLGPSGCGKTTTLRLIAGFERPDSGKILLDGADMAATPPHKRKVNTVFQSYALFPHLDVFDNVAFGLRRRKEKRAEIRQLVLQVLEAVRLSGLERRRPVQLSGGQQQRVALARALVLNPSVLLLDEPLGALDAKLRKALQLELKGIQEQFGITFVYVTHDQEEALTMSDRIAVMSDGHVEQVATPSEMYEEPKTAFVADFLGVSNLMTVHVEPDGDACRVKLGDFTLRALGGEVGARGDARAVIRPERVRVEPYESTGENRVPGMIERVVYLGSSEQLVIRLASGEIVHASVANDGSARDYAQGTAVQAHLPAEALRVLPPPRGVSDTTGV